MIKLPISLRPNSPNCIWCLKPTDHTGGNTDPKPSSNYHNIYYRCYNHPQAIVYVINFNNEDWFLQTINVYVTNKIRINYFSYPQNPNIQNTIEHNLTTSLQIEDPNMYHWKDVINLPNYESSWIFNISYDELISKVKGYLPFL